MWTSTSRTDRAKGIRVAPIPGLDHCLVTRPTCCRSAPFTAWLVVETTDFTDHNGHHGTPTTRQLHVVERFTRGDGDTISYEATINNPMSWVRTWTLALPLRREQGVGIGIFEYACHEGNLGMTGILRGARADEKAASSPWCK